MFSFFLCSFSFFHVFHSENIGGGGELPPLSLLSPTLTPPKKKKIQYFFSLQSVSFSPFFLYKFNAEAALVPIFEAGKLI